jgi:hypothetical protein
MCCLRLLSYLVIFVLWEYSTVVVVEHTHLNAVSKVSSIYLPFEPNRQSPYLPLSLFYLSLSNPFAMAVTGVVIGAGSRGRTYCKPSLFLSLSSSLSPPLSLS